MKGQASVEFLIILGIVAVVFAISVSYFVNYGINSNAFLSEEKYRSLCSQVQNEIDTALSAGPYYERSFYLEQGLYNASVYGYEIHIEYSGGSVMCPTPAESSKNLSIGKNTIIYNGTGVYFT